MIAATSLSGQPQALNWQQALADAIADPAELCAVLGLDPALIEPAFAAAGKFPLRVPRGYVARMRRDDPRDPLLLQVLPGAAELVSTPDFTTDPVGDIASSTAPGLLHKYAGRALVVLSLIHISEPTRLLSI